MPSRRYYKFKEVDKEEKIKKFKILLFSFTGLIVFLFLAWLIFISPLFQIRNIIISDISYLNQGDILKAAARVAPLGLGENILILPKIRLKLGLAAAFPAITDIIIEKNLFHTLIVDFKKRIQVGIWCQQTILESQADNCYYFDKDGIAFANAPQTEGSLILKIIDASKDNVLLGGKVLDDDQINFITNFTNKIGENSKFKILEFKIKPGPSVDLEAITDKNWVIYLDDTQDPMAAGNNLLMILDEAVKNTGNLEYIDLRIPSRIFYKLR